MFKSISRFGLPILLRIRSSLIRVFDFPPSLELDPTKENGWNTLDKLQVSEVAVAEMKLLHITLSQMQQGLHTLGISGFTFAPLQHVTPAADELISTLSEKLGQDHAEGRIREGLWGQYQIQLRILKSAKSFEVEIMHAPFVRYLLLWCTWQSGPQLNAPSSVQGIPIQKSESRT